MSVLLIVCVMKNALMLAFISSVCGVAVILAKSLVMTLLLALAAGLAIHLAIKEYFKYVNEKSSAITAGYLVHPRIDDR